MKKTLKKVILSAFLFALPMQVKAAEYTVKYNYTTKDTLTQEQLQNLKKLDNHTVTKDTDVTIVYEKNDSCEMSQLPKVEETKMPTTVKVEETKTPTAAKVEQTNQVKVNHKNPINTADQNNVATTAAILFVSAAVIAIAYKNRKALKVVAVGALVATGVFTVTSLNAFEQKADKTITVAENTVLDFTSEKVDCYDILGVMIEEVPTTPEQPTTPEEPKTPEQPTTPEKPTTPEEPKTPEQPTQPEQPVEKRGTVKVKFVNTQGEEIADSEIVKDNELVDTPYKTEPKAIDGYNFQHLDLDNGVQAEGNVVEGEQTVIFVYEKQVRGTVKVVYKLEDGTVLEESTLKDNELVGTPYNAAQKAFEGYRFLRMADETAPVNGEVKEAEQVVVFVYEPDTDYDDFDND